MGEAVVAGRSSCYNIGAAVMALDDDVVEIVKCWSDCP